MKTHNLHAIISVALVCLGSFLQFSGEFNLSPAFGKGPGSASKTSPQPGSGNTVPQPGPLTITSFSLFGKMAGTNSSTVKVPGYTYTPSASLKMAFTGGQLQIIHYRASQSPNFPNANWIVLKAGQDPVFSFEGSLQVAEGVKTVYVQLMNASGVSNVKSAQISYRLPPHIATFSLGTGTVNTAVTNTRQVQLVWTKTGNATHYRAGENASSFQGQQFLPLPVSGPPTFTLSAGEGDKAVHLQLLDQPNPQQPAISASSNVSTATIRYKVRDLYSIEGNQVDVLRQHAVSRGFNFGCQVQQGNSCQYLVGNNWGLFLRAVPFLSCQTPQLFQTPGMPHGIEMCTFAPFDISFALFGGGSRLQSGWKLMSVLIEGKNGAFATPGNANGAKCTTWNWTTPPQPGSDNPYFGVRLQNPATPGVCAVPEGTASGQHDGYVELKRIQLEGPAGRDWREAF